MKKGQGQEAPLTACGPTSGSRRGHPAWHAPLPRPRPSAATTACSPHLPELPGAIIDFAWGGILTRSYYVCRHVSPGETNPWLPKGIPPPVSPAFLLLSSQIQEVTFVSFQLSLSPFLSQRPAERKGKPPHTETSRREKQAPCPAGSPQHPTTCPGSTCPAP